MLHLVGCIYHTLTMHGPMNIKQLSPLHNDSTCISQKSSRALMIKYITFSNCIKFDCELCDRIKCCTMGCVKKGLKTLHET